MSTPARRKPLRRALSLALALALGLVLAPALTAQDAPVQLTGRLESSLTWFHDELPDGGQSLGAVEGWAGLSGGTRDVKSELRLGYANLPTPALSLQRAWTKFRFPGMRFTTGLGRLAWGPGFVLVPGDLLFDNVGTELDFGGDELRVEGAWLGDAWFALGDEAFLEAGVLQDAVGLRASAAPGGVTLEAAGAWDRTNDLVKAAVSSQFHAGVDWYATLRQDWSTREAPRDPWDRSVAGAGAFGLFSLGQDVSLTTRHEALVRARDWWGAWHSYHDASVAWDHWTVTGRVVVDRTPAADAAWSPTAEVRWAPLQNLGLSLTAPLQPPWLVRGAVTAKW